MIGSPNWLRRLDRHSRMERKTDGGMDRSHTTRSHAAKAELISKAKPGQLQPRHGGRLPLQALENRRQ